MDSPQPQVQPQTGFRSRRSYPSLNQISVAPLTPRYPIDDDDDNANESQRDYFTPRNEATETPTRTSYLSSYSVPGTPGVLSRTPSRSGSRARHHTRSKSSTPAHLSDSSLHDQNVSQPLHHHHHHSRSSGSGRTKRPAAVRYQTADSQDPEWMLRAGIALASSAREEKGQSWLVKRESSTSLVSEGQKYEVDAVSQSLRTGMGRRSRSGRSTPASRSRTASRRNSRPDLSMTGLEMTMPSSSKRSSFHAGSTPRTPHTSDEPRSSLSLLPEFIDERVRAEMRDTIQHEVDGYDSAASDDWDLEEEDEEIDEHELRRLTRERGFGLGSFIDRLVEWTLFGVDDWPLSSTDPLNNGPLASEEPNPVDHEDQEVHSPVGLSDNEHDETRSHASDTNDEVLTAEKAGENGGWEDAGWFFRAIRRSLITS
ncbi:hypothetical protein BJX63DRAFT_332632 [Aspergillus granulosus]|uniref:Uncharacterized protein n=1 Tax=Aspergillus granulosus TaxID=176169 RepID=A0ABR4H3D1_9EURO